MDSNSMIGNFFDSVVSFFTGGDIIIPWCERDVIVSQPDWKQSWILKKIIEDKMAKNGVIGLCITGTAIALIAGGIGAALARKK